MMGTASGKLMKSWYGSTSTRRAMHLCCDVVGMASGKRMKSWVDVALI